MRHCQNCHLYLPINQHIFGTTLALFCSFPVNPYLLYLVQSKILQTAVSFKRSGRFAVKVVVIILIKKIRRILQSERAEANYFSTMVFIFIAVLLLAFIIDLFSIISTKQELDLCADQMVKQIQLSGGINAETDQLFNFLCSQIEGAHNISYSIDASYKTPTPSGMNRAIQLGSPFYITITGETKLGGFWNFDLIHITVVSRAAGVSEHYWK